MLVAGYLYGSCSEQRLGNEINSNFACRWFYGLGLTEIVTDATTISVDCARQCGLRQAFAPGKVLGVPVGA